MENDIIYHYDTNTYLVYYYNEINKFKKWLYEFGFLNADILDDNWVVKGYHIYKIPDDYIKQLSENNYLILDYVGHAYHVIPTDKQTQEQRIFIKSIFESY